MGTGKKKPGQTAPNNEKYKLMYFVPYTITSLCVGKHPYLST
jgi:hypothetical protein